MNINYITRILILLTIHSCIAMNNDTMPTLISLTPDEFDRVVDERAQTILAGKMLDAKKQHQTHAHALQLQYDALKQSVDREHKYRLKTEQEKKELLNRLEQLQQKNKESDAALQTSQNSPIITQPQTFMEQIITHPKVFALLSGIMLFTTAGISYYLGAHSASAKNDDEDK